MAIKPIMTYLRRPFSSLGCPTLDTSGLFTPLQHHHFPTYSTAMEYLPRDMSSDHMTAPSQWQSIVGLDRAPLTKEKGHEQPL